jgi:hypothetical protein
MQRRMKKNKINGNFVNSRRLGCVVFLMDLRGLTPTTLTMRRGKYRPQA